MRILVAVVIVVLAACGGDGGGSMNGPEVVAARFLDAALKTDAGGTWETIHPELRALTTRAAYTECYLADSEPASGDIDLEVGDTYEEGGLTFVDVAIEASGLLGSQELTVTVMTLEDDAGDWWVVGTLVPGEEERPGCVPGSTEKRDELVAA
jgi:hypothetical protein